MITTQQLVEQYIPLANKLANQAKRTLPRFIDIEDLKSAAYLGLVEAGSRFNAELGIKFSTFAYPRVFGSIYDYLREQGWVKKGDLSRMFSLDSVRSDDKECSLLNTLEAKSEGDTEECFEAITIKLDDHAKKVLRCYFIDDFSMKEVGEKFGVSESRISQLIKEYKMRIRSNWTESDLCEELAA
jgi:RNA polymerase sigma factor (sigma-70 family)